MESIGIKTLNNHFDRRFFFLSFLMCLFCFSFFSTGVLAAVKSTSKIDSWTGSGDAWYADNNEIPGDSSEFSLSVTEVRDLAVPDKEVDMEIEQWMYGIFNWKFQDSNMEEVNSDQEDRSPGNELLLNDLLNPVNDPEPVLETWMLHPLHQENETAIGIL